MSWLGFFKAPAGRNGNGPFGSPAPATYSVSLFSIWLPSLAIVFSGLDPPCFMYIAAATSEVRGGVASVGRDDWLPACHPHNNAPRAPLKHPAVRSLGLASWEVACISMGYGATKGSVTGCANMAVAPAVSTPSTARGASRWVSAPAEEVSLEVAAKRQSGPDRADAIGGGRAPFLACDSSDLGASTVLSGELPWRGTHGLTDSPPIGMGSHSDSSAWRQRAGGASRPSSGCVCFEPAFSCDSGLVVPLVIAAGGCRSSASSVFSRSVRRSTPHLLPHPSRPSRCRPRWTLHSCCAVFQPRPYYAAPRDEVRAEPPRRPRGRLGRARQPAGTHIVRALLPDAHDRRRGALRRRRVVAALAAGLSLACHGSHVAAVFCNRHNIGVGGDDC